MIIKFSKNNILKYTTFSYLREIIQNLYHFKNSLDLPHEFCDFHPLYDEILDKYEKIGHCGHFTLYKNSKENNIRYRFLYE